MEMYPSVEVEMIIQNRFDDLIEQGVDLAIHTGTLGDSSLIAKRLVSSCWSAFASPAYIQKYGKPQTLEKLAEHKFLTFSYQQAGESD